MSKRKVVAMKLLSHLVAANCEFASVAGLEARELNLLEHRMGFEPMNTGFADQRVSHFAIGAHRLRFESKPHCRIS
jgi:hypothetical protein